jgi:hypothetical protein
LERLFILDRWAAKGECANPHFNVKAPVKARGKTNII